MQTPEERLAVLEQTTAAHIKEVNENLAMTIGLVLLQTRDIKKISQRLDEMQENLQNTFSVHVDATNAHFDLLQKYVDKTNASLSSLEAQLGEHTARFDHAETLLTQILVRLPEKP